MRTINFVITLATTLLRSSKERNGEMSVGVSEFDDRDPEEVTRDFQHKV